jgi:hypothetical protein
MILSQDKNFGKWSPTWEGPLRAVVIVPGNAYFIEFWRVDNSLTW